MAKLSSIAKEKRRERLVKLKWEKRQALRATIRDPKKSEEEKVEAQRKLNAMPRDSAPCRLRNRCRMTGRARGYLRKFHLSRICFRELANSGMIPGVVKASW